MLLNIEYEPKIQRKKALLGNKKNVLYFLFLSYARQSPEVKVASNFVFIFHKNILLSCDVCLLIDSLRKMMFDLTSNFWYQR